jgi:hypothetical protein
LRLNSHNYGGINLQSAKKWAYAGPEYAEFTENPALRGNDDLKSSFVGHPNRYGLPVSARQDVGVARGRSRLAVTAVQPPVHFN